MEAGDWIGLAAIVVPITGAMVGALWVYLGSRITAAQARADTAHGRIEAHALMHSAYREEVATTYVRRDDLRERLVEILTPIKDAVAATNRKLDRMERSSLKLLERMHIPAVLPDETDQ